MAQTERGFVEIEGGELYYEVTGEGFPLVLIHAGVADHTMWDDQIEEFSRRYRVIRYDTRGFGKTSSKPVSFSNRQDLRDLLHHLGEERAFLVGNSRGGVIATDFTLEFPEMVAALIAVGSGLSGFEGDDTPQEMQIFKEMEKAEKAKDWEKVAELFVITWAAGPTRSLEEVNPSVCERVKQMCLSNARLHADEEEPKPRVLEPPAARRLAEIKVPTLVIIGDKDVLSCQQAAEKLAASIPGARKLVFPDTAHVVSMERPAEFTRAVLDFLEGLA